MLIRGTNVAQTQAKEAANNAEMELTELVLNLWKEKASFLLITLSITAIGVLYAFASTPIYSISAQLIRPTEATLRQLEPNISNLSLQSIYTVNNLNIETQELLAQLNSKSFQHPTKTYKHLSDSAFTIFLSVLSDPSHITDVAQKDATIIKGGLNITFDDNYLNKIKKLRIIEYPITEDKTNELSPDNYNISLTGTDRNKLKEILKLDLEEANRKATEQVKSKVIYNLNLQIIKKSEAQQARMEVQENKINTHKSYLLEKRENDIRTLREAYKIAAALEIKNSETPAPSQLKPKNGDVYLQGTKLLALKIANIEGLDSKTFNDDSLLQMKAQRSLLSTTSHIDQLTQEKERINKNKYNLNFYNTTFDTPQSPIKPKKALIIAFSLAIGCILGLLIALIRVVHSRQK
jgi:chain length determinant protein (polysaccharide antigen chain regulator)